jgi:hypothetical protein
MKRRFHPWFALLASLGLAGCGSSQMNRIDANRDLYETWPIEVRQAVLDGKVEAGMNADMVRVAWGQPSEVVVQSSNGDEIWVYKKGGEDPAMMNSGYPGGMGASRGTGLVIGTGRGGTMVGTTMGTGIGVGMGGMGVGSSGIGMGGTGIGMGGTGMGSPIMTRPTPAEVREVVFRDGVVLRADNP